MTLKGLKGYRKFIVTVGVILIATGLVIWGKITADNFVDLAKWVTGLYLGANAVQAIGTVAAEKIEVKPKT